MKKITLLFISFLLFSININSQTTNKGKFAIGLSNSMKNMDKLTEDFLNQIDQPSNGNMYQFSVNINPHYYLTKSIALGLGFNTSLNKDSGETDNISFDQTFNAVQYGPYLRYVHSKALVEYIPLKIFKNMYPYADANYSMGSATYKQELTNTDNINSKYDIESYAVSAGLMFDFYFLREDSSKLIKLLSYLYIDLGASYSSLSISPVDDESNNSEESGVNFRLNLGIKF